MLAPFQCEVAVNSRVPRSWVYALALSGVLTVEHTHQNPNPVIMAHEQRLKREWIWVDGVIDRPRPSLLPSYTGLLLYPGCLASRYSLIIPHHPTKTARQTPFLAQSQILYRHSSGNWRSY